MTEVPFGLTLRDVVAGIGGWGLVSTVIIILIQWLFCTERVPRPVLLYRSLSLGAFFCSLIIRGVSDTPIPWDFNTILCFANLSFAQFLVMAFTYRRIITTHRGELGDRCPGQEVE